MSSGLDWGRYLETGYLRLGRLLDDATLSAMRERIDSIMLGRIDTSTFQMQLDTGGDYEALPDPVPGLITPTLDYRKIQGLETDPLFRAFLTRGIFREICAWHYGPHAEISVFRAMVMNKPAGKGTVLPWHQDGGDVWALDRDPLVTTWTALDAATMESGCVQVIPGTHALGLLTKRGSTLSSEDAARYGTEDRVEYLEVEAGESLLLHNWLIHRSDVNSRPTPRRAFTACYMDARTISTLTGNGFPVIFGESRGAPADAYRFVSALKEENRHLSRAAAEAARYAKSLEEANRSLEEMRAEAERYAKSLEAARGPS